MKEKYIYLSDIISMGLLYRYKCNKNMMVTYDKIENYKNIVKENLKEMNSPYELIEYEMPSNIYFIGDNEKKTTYAVINPEIDIEKEMITYLNQVPSDVLIAGKQKNALKAIELEWAEDHFVRIEVKKEENPSLLDLFNSDIFKEMIKSRKY